ncbi:2-dehydro-3-deoxy-D-gluconate 5-dehydrogenase [Nymphon striatum]|nr:2-dehydro-3-deoxy-D-gluconate 5-dehydrogenase [Nymphon striatum]
MENLFDLSGKTALVTGCKRGIGKAMAIALAQAGADIIGVSASLEAKGSEVEKEVKAIGRNFSAYTCNFSDRKQLRSFIEQIEIDGHEPDILVNNAGTIKRAAITEHDDNIWDEVLEVNLTAQFVLTREIGRGMLKRGRGKVIFMASLLTFPRWNHSRVSNSCPAHEANPTQTINIKELIVIGCHNQTAKGKKTKAPNMPVKSCKT